MQVPAPAGANTSPVLTPDPECPLSLVTRVRAAAPSGQRETCLRVTLPAAQGHRDFHGDVHEPWPQPSVPANFPGLPLGWPPKWVLRATGPVFESTAFCGELQPPEAHTSSPRCSQVSPMKGYLQNRKSVEP